MPTQNAAHHSISATFEELPTEEELATSTLWPEVEKVYGHGYEVSIACSLAAPSWGKADAQIAAMASSPDHALLATACEARNLEHAAVRLSSTTTWDSVGQPLSGHTLTVTRIAFHPEKDDRRILTVSRDRSWRVWQAEGEAEYTCSAVLEKAHARMINDGCWWLGGFVTAGRDKCVKVWAQSAENQWIEAATIKLEEGATAVDAVNHAGWDLLAVGSEGGRIAIYELVRESGSLAVKLLSQLDET